MRRVIIPVMFFFFFACSQSTEKPGEPGETKMKSTFIEVSNFTLSSLDGVEMSLLDFKGRVIIMDFWATWCGPCEVEIPSFVELQEEYGEKGLQILGVSLDRGGKEDLINFCDNLNINYPILIGNNALANKFGVQAIPTTYIIDREGNLFKKYIGVRGKEVFKNDIEQLIR